MPRLSAGTGAHHKLIWHDTIRHRAAATQPAAPKSRDVAAQTFVYWRILSTVLKPKNIIPFQVLKPKNTLPKQIRKGMAAALIAGLHDPSQTTLGYHHKDAIRFEEKMQFDPMPSSEDILFSSKLDKQPCHSKNKWRSTFVAITPDNLFLAKDETSETCLERLPLHQVASITEHEASVDRTGATKATLTTGEQSQKTSSSMERPATLEIHVVRARDLLAADRGGTSDPYVSIQVQDGKTVGKTHTIKKTLNPEWDQRFEIPLGVPQRNSKLILKCKDYDAMGTDDPLGTVEIDLRTLTPGKEYKGWHSLHHEDEDSGKSGMLELKYKLEEADPEEEATCYFVHLETIPGKHSRKFYL